MRHRIIALAIVAATGITATAAAQQPIPIALRTTAARPPAPVDGIVTLNLASGAFIKLRAQDIDYDKTDAYKNRVIIVAQQITPMVAKDSGRKYQNLVFTNRFVATAWDDDIDFEEMRSAFPIVLSRQRATAGMTLTNFQRLQEGMSVGELNAILGRAGELTSSSDVGEHSSALYQWDERGATITAVFNNGKLVSKSQYGLR